MEEIRRLVIHQLEVEGLMSTRELARKLGYAKLNNTLSLIVKRLVAEGLVRLANPKQAHSPNQLLILQ